MFFVLHCGGVGFVRGGINNFGGGWKLGSEVCLFIAVCF